MDIDASLKMVLGLSSGKEFIVDRVMLFPEAAIQEISALRAKAQEELSGFSTGIGFWGSPGWAIGGAMILGLAESLVTNAKAKGGIKILQDVASKVERLKSMGEFFDLAAVDGIQWPRPGDWRASQSRQAEVRAKGMALAGAFVRAALINTDITTTTIVTERNGFIHDQGEFVTFDLGGEPVAVRWTSVERYELVRTAQTEPSKPKDEDTRAVLPPPLPASRDAAREAIGLRDNNARGFGRRIS